MPIRIPKLTIAVTAFIDAAALRTETAIENDLNALLAQGASTEVIRQFLIDNADGYRKAFVNQVMTPIRESVNRITVSSYWEEIKGESNYWRWIYEPTAQHCTTCVFRNGMVGTRAQFAAIGIPGAGTTKCRGGCRCTLVPITKEVYESSSKKLAA